MELWTRKGKATSCIIWGSCWGMCCSFWLLLWTLCLHFCRTPVSISAVWATSYFLCKTAPAILIASLFFFTSFDDLHKMHCLIMFTVLTLSAHLFLYLWIYVKMTSAFPNQCPYVHDSSVPAELMGEGRKTAEVYWLWISWELNLWKNSLGSPCWALTIVNFMIFSDMLPASPAKSPGHLHWAEKTRPYMLGKTQAFFKAEWNWKMITGSLVVNVSHCFVLKSKFSCGKRKGRSSQWVHWESAHWF